MKKLIIISLSCAFLIASGGTFALKNDGVSFSNPGVAKVRSNNNGVSGVTNVRRNYKIPSTISH